MASGEELLSANEFATTSSSDQIGGVTFFMILGPRWDRGSDA